jgi:hypothetical protein
MHLRRELCVIVVAAGVAAASPSAAINIIPVFNATDNETPPFDLFNGGIQDLFEYSEGYYDDMLEGGGYTLTVNYWYEDLSGSFIGFFNPVTTVGNRVIEANLRIDTRVGDGGDYRNWYIDSTPASDGEFEMEKTLWGDADFSVRSAFIASPDTPDAFEVGYRGLAVDGSAAEGKYDMLSTVLHEIGHALGIRGGATHENADDDYDMNPDFLFGENVAAEIDSNDEGPDPGHVLASTMLMCGGCGAANVRRRPSHADLFAIATSAGLTTLDVPRREFYGGGVFNFAPNWSGGRTPDTNDDAYVRDAGLVVMNANDTVANLTILTSDLATGNNNLNVSGLLHVASRFSNVKAKVIVGTGGAVSADDIEISRNGEVDVVDSTLTVGDDLDILPRELPGESDGLLSGSGTVNIGGTLRNRGTIKPEGGILTINAGSFDLDGPSGGFGVRRVDVTAGNVIFNGPHIGSFAGMIDVGFARAATFENSWTLGESGTLTITDGGLILNAAWQADGIIEINHPTPIGIVGVGGTGAMTLGPTGQIITNGVVDFLGPSTIQGALDVETDIARFSGGGTFADSANVSLAAGTELHLILEQTYTIESNATFAGPGMIVNGGLATLMFESNADVGAPLLNHGRVEIGASLGRLNMDANFEQTATGTIEFEIGGLIPRLYDLLDATGFSATLDGTLELVVINGFMPMPGDLFEIITADHVVGEYSTILGADLANGSYIDVTYRTGSVLLEVISGLLGDYNNNGTVDAADYTVWRDRLGDLEALPNDDSAGVGPDDYTRWKMHFGVTLPGAGSLATSRAVPEPRGIIMFAVALGCLAGAHRRFCPTARQTKT